MRRMGRCRARACAAVVAVLGVAVASAQSDTTVPGSIHTIFSTECNRYFDWCATRPGRLAQATQPCAPLVRRTLLTHPLSRSFAVAVTCRQSLGLVHSAKHVGQTGPITRLMACNECVISRCRCHCLVWATACSSLLTTLCLVSPPPCFPCLRSPSYKTDVVVDTHTHPNWAVHPVTGDRYAPYNKPASIVHWLEHGQVTAEYVIILDADMVIRKPMSVELVGAGPGRPVSAHYGYLVGIFEDHHMGVKSRVKFASPPQQVGGFSVMHIDDLRRVAPRWLYWTEEVRKDPDSWGNTGDIFNNNGKSGPPWIAEMYGYVFACAEAGLVFTVSEDFMLYPGYEPPSPEPWPLVMHYGVTYSQGWYAFDKHWYMMTDMTTCPGQMFQKPPTPEELGLTPGSGEYRQSEVALSVAWGLHNATKQHIISACGIADPPDPPKRRYRCVTGANSVVVCNERAADDLDPPPPPPSSPPPRAEEQQAAAMLRGADAAGEAVVSAAPVTVKAETVPQQPTACVDAVPECCAWAAQGDCEQNPSFMAKRCPRACGSCGPGVGKPAGAACDEAAGDASRRGATPGGARGDPPVVVGGGGAGAREHLDPAEREQSFTPDRVILPHDGQAQEHAAMQARSGENTDDVQPGKGGGVPPAAVTGATTAGGGVSRDDAHAREAPEEVNHDLLLMQRLVARTGGLGDAVWSEMDEQLVQQRERQHQRRHFELVALLWACGLLGAIAAARGLLTRKRRGASSSWLPITVAQDDRKGV